MCPMKDHFFREFSTSAYLSQSVANSERAQVGRFGTKMRIHRTQPLLSSARGF